MFNLVLESDDWCVLHKPLAWFKDTGRAQQRWVPALLNKQLLFPPLAVQHKSKAPTLKHWRMVFLHFPPASILCLSLPSTCTHVKRNFPFFLVKEWFLIAPMHMEDFNIQNVCARQITLSPSLNIQGFLPASELQKNK